MKPLLQQALCELLHGQLMLRGAVSLGDAGVIGVRRVPGGAVRVAPGRVRVSPPVDRIEIQSSFDGFDPGLVVREQDVLSMLSLKTGIPLQQVDALFRDWTHRVRDALRGGEPVDLAPLGRFAGDDGVIGFVAADRLAIEVNHRFAGLQEIELDVPDGGDGSTTPEGSTSGDALRGAAGSGHPSGGPADHSRAGHPSAARRGRPGLVASFVILVLMLPAGLYWAIETGRLHAAWPWALPTTVDAGRDGSIGAPSAPPSTAPSAASATSPAISPATSPSPAAPEPSSTSSAPDTPYGLFGSFDPDLRNAYTLVLFTFSESGRAADAAIPLIDAGYRLEIVTRWKGDQPFWLLCVGQFESREQALSAVDTLDEPYRSDYAVLLLP